MRIFLVYLLAFIGTSIIDALWHLQWFQPTALFPKIVSQFLIVASIMFIVLYKTQGRPKLPEAALMGSVAGILSISVYAFEKIAIGEFIWGPIFGALSGMLIALLAKKFL